MVAVLRHEVLAAGHAPLALGVHHVDHDIQGACLLNLTRTLLVDGVFLDNIPAGERHNSQIGRGKSLRIEIVTDAQLTLVVLSPTARSVELSNSLQIVDQTAVSAVDQTLEVLQVAVVHRSNVRALVSSQGLVGALETDGTLSHRINDRDRDVLRGGGVGRLNIVRNGGLVLVLDVANVLLIVLQELVGRNNLRATTA